MSTLKWPAEYGDPSWFIHDRFGLFIHFGLYSTAGRHEWMMTRERLTPEAYRKYFDHFDPDLYDPVQWAKAAKAAGMKYFVITTKHHEGFCLWDSKLTDYKVTNTPYGKDLLTPMVEAFRAEGIKIGFYHSLIDWYHPEFTVDGIHPQRDDEEAKLQNAGKDMAKYREFLHGQVRELLTEFGHIDYLWFDFSYEHYDYKWCRGKGKDDWDSVGLERMILELQPHIILNDRLDLRKGVITPEQYQPESVLTVDGQPVVWEACQTLNGSWGYDRDNLDWKSSHMLIQMLIDTVSKGGNLLLNVGPNGRGEMDTRSLERLAEIGEWTRLHGRAIYGAGPCAEYVAPPECRYTQRGDRLYLHLLSWPMNHIHLEGLAGKIAFAQLLNDGSEIKIASERKPSDHLDYLDSDHEGKQKLTLLLPVQKPNVAVPVIELFLK